MHEPAALLQNLLEGLVMHEATALLQKILEGCLLETRARLFSPSLLHKNLCARVHKRACVLDSA